MVTGRSLSLSLKLLFSADSTIELIQCPLSLGFFSWLIFTTFATLSGDTETKSIDSASNCFAGVGSRVVSRISFSRLWFNRVSHDMTIREAMIGVGNE